MVRRLSTPRLITLEPTAVIPLPIAYGGTSATSAQDALRNLHAISFSEKGAPNGVATLDENGIVPLSQLPPFSIDAVALSGPTQVLPSSTTTYHITNYTNQITYSAIAQRGQVSLIEDTLYYRAPTTIGADTITINTTTFHITVSGEVITPARILTDTKARISLSPTFHKLNAQLPSSDTVVSTKWELSSSVFFDADVITTTVQGASTLWKPNVTLQPNTTYYVRAKDYAKNAADTGWSKVVAVTTLDLPYWVSSLYGEAEKFFNATVVADDRLYCVGSLYHRSVGETNYTARAFFTCYTTQGEVLWQKLLLTPVNSTLSGVTLLNDTFYAVGYVVQSSSNTIPLLIAFNRAGDVLWQYTLNGSGLDVLYHVTTDGNYLYASGAQSTNASGFMKRPDAYLIKYDTLGNLIWQRSVNLRGSECSFNACLYDSSVLYAVGYTGSDLYVSAWNPQGTLLWQTGTSLSSGSATLLDIASDANTLYAVGSYVTSNGTRRSYMVHLNKNGALVRQSAFSSGANDVATSIALDDTQLYVSTYSGSGTVNSHLVRFTKVGALNKSLSLTGAGTKILQRLKCHGNRLYAVGFLTSLNGSYRDTLALSAPATLEVAPVALPSTNLSVLGFESNTYTQTSVSLGFSSKSFSTSTPTLTLTQARYPLVDASTAMSTSLYC
jgi:hypothetical protein